MQKSLWFLAALLLAMPAAADDYEDFRDFALAAFGAERDPLVYEFYGTQLQTPDGYWQYVSERSASIGFRTNLPARSHLDYGTSTSYGSQTPASDRPYAVHSHRLVDLQPGTTYHYRVVAEDERGNVVYGPDRTVVPQSMPAAIRIPDDMGGGPPYLLDTPGATYVLTEDVVADGKAFEISAADITLDLGGHTVIYNDTFQSIAGDWPVYVDDAAFGIRSMGYRENIRVLNGRIRQGAGRNGTHAGASIGFNPIYVRSGNGFEVAGVEFDYAGDQMVGLFMHWGSQDAHIHHNVFVDRGSVILNRHGSGSRALLFYGGDYADAHIHDNLVKRSRHGGIQGNLVHDNEIHLDSYAINSFGIARGDEATIRDNRIFGTGYHVIGIAWGRGNHYDGNFVHLVGQGPDHRDEEYGNQESLNGFRLTQYAGSHADYSNNLYEDNLILIQGGDCIDGACTEARGIQHSADADVVDNVIRNNVIKVDMADNIDQAAAIVTQGLSKRCGTEAPLLWQDNVLISNIANVRMGDYYAAGCNHRMHGNHHVRIGDRSDYRTFQFDVGWAVRDHHVVDASYAGGASIDSVAFRHPEQELHVGWTVQVRVLDDTQPAPGATVTAYDLDGAEIAQGVTDAAGNFSLIVPERIRRQGGDQWLTSTRFVAALDGETVETTRLIQSQTEVLLFFGEAPNEMFGNGFESR